MFDLCVFSAIVFFFFMETVCFSDYVFILLNKPFNKTLCINYMLNKWRNTQLLQKKTSTLKKKMYILHFDIEGKSINSTSYESGLTVYTNTDTVLNNPCIPNINKKKSDCIQKPNQLWAMPPPNQNSANMGRSCKISVPYVLDFFMAILHISA